MTAPNRVTIRDVARRAGVSVATVSRVLGGEYPVLAATRNKVVRAVRELDYVPNAHARALSAARPGAVAIVVNSVAVPYYALIAQGVEEQAAQEGRLSLICTTGGDTGRELSVVQLMREQRAEAVILVGSVVVDEEYRKRMTEYAHALAAAGSRLVLCGRPPLGDGVPALVVNFDNTGGAHAVTAHLLSAGHRRILYLGLRPGHSTSDSRVAGYRAALAEYGVPADPGLEVPAEFDRESGYAAMRRLLAAGPPRFTAVFAGNDVVAAGAIQALREHGLRVPEDVSIVGYDDVPPAQDLGLTTVHLPHDELGRAAVRLALGRRTPGSPLPSPLPAPLLAPRPGAAGPPEAGGPDGDGPARVLTLGTHIVVRSSVRRLGPR
ncbi:LacI family transcriptional regulator [Actinomadura sp. ATCC 31491]|uniref:LacI family transcriptional regulator n=1 Tax=Actinomadura luzonensis TaxID=2805427 RepID=A0ABT0G382_9ACTN|nr:LacI family DNA-binding transcriptional regulator [Actinomadura luzonensis]MCK2218581.1 LacI family transcriptional regulator [Actinomadura luzonensis]